jgi:hypothetical protein
LSGIGRAVPFFVPYAPGAGDAESVYHVLRSAVRRKTGRSPGPRRVRRLAYTRDGHRCQSTVGEHDEPGGETVLAIFECEGCYVVCTRSHGLAGGPPVVVEAADLLDVEDFER